MPRLVRTATLSLLLVTGAAPGVAWAAGHQPALPYQDASAVALGAGLYAEHCAACHGANLEGEPNWRERDADGYLPAPPHDVTGHTWHHPDAQLFAIVKYGTEALVGRGYRSNMAGYADILSDAQILATLAYIKAQWPDRVIETHNTINARAAGAGSDAGSGSAD